MGGQARRRVPHRLGLALFALALFLRLLPAGFMPSATAGGFVICTAEGIVPLAGTPGGDPIDREARDSCPFALAAAPVLPPAPPEPARAARPLPATAEAAPLPGLAGASPPGLPRSTGPPARA